MTKKILLVAMLGIPLLVGCSAEHWTGRIEPQTTITVNPINKTISFKDTKDNDLVLKGLRSTGADGKLTSLDIDELSIRNASNSVIAADAARMAEIRATMALQQQYLEALLTGLTRITESLAPVLIRYAPAQPPTPTPTPAPGVIVTTPGGG